MKKSLLIILIVAFVISACGPSEADIQKAIAQTQAAYTPTPSFTKTPVSTNTPKPTNTPLPTPTPIVGTFKFPLHIGDSITLETIPEEYRSDPTKNGGEMEFKLLGVTRGADAKALAQSSDLFIYQEPISGQEYIAVRGYFQMLSSLDNNRTWPLTPSWHLTLRNEDSGTDVWSVDPITSIAEGYIPLEGEGWVFFLVRENSNPLLYFQPELITMEQHGIRTSGAYFDLSGQQ